MHIGGYRVEVSMLKSWSGISKSNILAKLCMYLFTLR